MDRDLGGEIVADAWLVLNRELLMQMFGQVLPDQPRADVGRAARRIADQPAHRMIRIVTVRCARGTGDDGNKAAGKSQRRDCSTQTLHSDLPPAFSRYD